MIARSDITGAILAGGRARRMGGISKGLVELAGIPFIRHIANTLCPQVATVVINANAHLDEYRAFGFSVIGDRLDGFQGPLAGVASVMAAAATPYLAIVPCDSPFLPPNLIAALALALCQQRAEISVVECHGKMQPVFALMSRHLRDDLDDYLAHDGRKIDTWYTRHRLTVVDYSSNAEAFLNINSWDELRDAKLRLGA